MVKVLANVLPDIIQSSIHLYCTGYGIRSKKSSKPKMDKQDEKQNHHCHSYIITAKLRRCFDWGKKERAAFDRETSLTTQKTRTFI